MFFDHRGLQSDVDIILEACDVRALDIAKPNTTPRFADVLRRAAVAHALVDAWRSSSKLGDVVANDRAPVLKGGSGRRRCRIENAEERGRNRSRHDPTL